ncbi:MAG: hypothetical protein HDS22_03440, partial [Bacteroides sp.]|nr:hypothetical protein [Bacteroides sp.]
MRKILTNILGLAMAFSASAADLNLMPYYSADLCWAGASLEGTTANWENAWGGLVFNMNNQDYDSYDYVVMELAEPSATKMKMEVYYADETSASSTAEFEVGSKQLKLDLSDLKTNIQKIALMAAKPTSATLSKAVLTDTFVTDPVLWEGSFDIPNMNVTNFTIKGDKFATLKSGDRMTVYFNVGEAENYGTIQLCYGWTKLACDSERTNTNNSGNYSPTTTETAVIITDDADIEGLKKSGLRIKGKNVIIKKVMLTPEGVEPTPPEDLDPTPGTGDDNNSGNTPETGTVTN